MRDLLFSPGRHHTPLPSSAPCPSHHHASQTRQTALCFPQMPQTCPAPATRQAAGRGFGGAERPSGNLSSTPRLLHCQETCSGKHALLLSQCHHFTKDVVECNDTIAESFSKVKTVGLFCFSSNTWLSDAVWKVASGDNTRCNHAIYLVMKQVVC